MVKKSYEFLLFFILVLWFMPSCYADDGDQVDFLVFSDMHVDTDKNTLPMEINPKESHGGNPRTNDADLTTFENMLDVIRKDIKNKTFDFDKKNPPEFILILGDMASHNRIKSKSGDSDATMKKNQEDSEANISRDINTVYKLLYDKFPGIPIFYVFGNNDALQAVEGSFSYVDREGTVHSPFEIATKGDTGWKNGFLSTGVFCSSQKSEYPCLIEQNILDGYYTAYIKPSIRLVVLNGVMFSPKHGNKVSQSIADKQIEWLGGQLEQARAKSEYVLIACHEPLGKSTSEGSDNKTPYAYFKPAYQDKIDELIKKYESEIIAILSGHTHFEEFKVFLEAKKLTAEMNVGVPAMSTADGNAPGIKEFYLLKKGEEKRWVLANYETLYFRPSSNQEKLELEKLYDFMDFYNCAREDARDDVGECIEKYSKYKIKKNITMFYTVGNDNPESKPIGELFKYKNSVFIELPENIQPGNALNSITTKRFLRAATNTNRKLLSMVVPRLQLKSCKFFN